jgi:pimeloyl-ACP methyl ester carboxylesterase
MKLGFKKIIVIGGSFGGYMAALLANERRFETLVLRAPANYPEEEFELPYRDTSAGKQDKNPDPRALTPLPLHHLWSGR